MTLRSSFVIIPDSLLNAAYRVSLRRPGAELHAGCSPPPHWPGAFGAEHRPARVNIYQTNDEKNKTIGISNKNIKLDFFAIIN